MHLCFLTHEERGSENELAADTELPPPPLAASGAFVFGKQAQFSLSVRPTIARQDLALIKREALAGKKKEKAVFFE